MLFPIQSEPRDRRIKEEKYHLRLPRILTLFFRPSVPTLLTLLAKLPPLPHPSNSLWRFCNEFPMFSTDPVRRGIFEQGTWPFWLRSTSLSSICPNVEPPQ